MTLGGRKKPSVPRSAVELRNVEMANMTIISHKTDAQTKLMSRKELDNGPTDDHDYKMNNDHRQILLDMAETDKCYSVFPGQ